MNVTSMIKSGILCATAASLLLACGCGSTNDNSKKADTKSAAAVKDKESVLDPDNPVTVTVWNYYNGDQLAAFETRVDEFNTTVGAQKGIIVTSESQGDIATLADALIDAVNGKAGAQEIPTLASVYAETAYILDEGDALVNLDDYFTEDVLAEFIPQFIETGRFNKDNELLEYPISKSTELFSVNTTDWAPFEEATGISLESVKTLEDLTAAAKDYYEWTDSLTPDVEEDGKALFGRDSMGNYIYLGSYELGHEIFKVQDGKLAVDMDRDAFKTLWDNYYVPYINGYFGSYSNFRSEDCKTGKIIALTSSSSSVGYLPDAVTDDDDNSHPIELSFSKPLSFENAPTSAVVQQGASYCMLKTDEAEQEGAAEFLKWFTESERNLEFSVLSGYAPVTKAASDENLVDEAYTGDKESTVGKNVLTALKMSIKLYSENTPYETKPFNGSKDVRSLLDNSMDTIAKADREKVVAAIAEGKTHEEAVAEFETDEYFDAWFTDLSNQVTALTSK